MHKEIIRIPFILAATLAVTSADAACSFQFQGPDSKTYTDKQISSFVDEQIRPKLSKNAGSFEIRVTADCQRNEATKTISITIDDTDYYITDIEGHHLNKEEATYQTSALTLSVTSLDSAVTNAKNINGLSLKEIQDVVKTLAFFFAETARFTDIETVAGSILAGDCAGQWLDFSTLLRRWGRISRLAIHEHNTQWTARGGSGENLIAPITADAVAAYNDAINAGPNGPNAPFVDPRDWNKMISVGACTRP